MYLARESPREDTLRIPMLDNRIIYSRSRAIIPEGAEVQIIKVASAGV
jgi:hypothetical protein